MSVSRCWETFVKDSVLITLLIALILIISFISNSIVLFKYDIPLGVDGFYYFLQVKTFLSEGSFYYPTYTPCILYLAVGLSKLGIEPSAAIKIISLLLYELLILAVYLITAQTTNNKLAGLIGASIVSTSALRLSWIVEFINNLGGITFLLYGIYCLGKNSKNKIWIVTGCFCLILAFLSHKSILPLTILIFFAYTVFKLFIKSLGSPYYLVLLFLFISTGFFYPLFFRLIFSDGIFLSLQENIAVSAKFPLFVKGFFEEKFILCILSPISFFASLRKSKINKNLALINGTISILTLFVTLNPFLNYTENLMTIPDRFLLFMHIEIAFLLAFTTEFTVTDKVSKIIITGVVLVLLLLGTRNFIKGNDDGFLTHRQNLIKNLEEFKEITPKQSLIIAQHGDQFLLTSILDIPSQRLLPEENKENSQIYWLIDGVPCNKIKKKSAILSVDGRLCTTILKNGDVEPISSQDKEILLSLNPHVKRLNKDQTESIIPTLESEKNKEF
jgi:hypothetical protein